MFLIDVQQAQRDRLAAFLDEANGVAPGPKIIPTLRARVVAVSGREMELDSYENARGRGLSREYTVTYRAELEANEELVDGQWWGDEPMQGEAEVSIEERFSDTDDDGRFRLTRAPGQDTGRLVLPYFAGDIGRKIATQHGAAIALTDAPGGTSVILRHALNDLDKYRQRQFRAADLSRQQETKHSLFMQRFHPVSGQLMYPVGFLRSGLYDGARDIDPIEPPLRIAG